MKTKYASVLAIVDGVEREVVTLRQPIDGWAELEGQDITLYLKGSPVGPINMLGTDMRLAIFEEPIGGEPIATLLLASPVEPGDFVAL